MPLRFKHRILDHLTHRSYQPTVAKNIASELRIDDELRDEFNQAIEELKHDGQIVVDEHGTVRLPTYGEEVTGVLRLNVRGFGFVVPDKPFREGDLFIPPGSTGDAISGDRVRAKVFRRSGRAGGGRSDTVGRIVEVIERGNENFVGTLKRKGGGKSRTWYVEPDGRILSDIVLIRDPHAKNAKEGDKVVFEMLHYPEDGQYGEGVIVQVLGEAGRPDVETQAVITAHGLRTGFSDGVHRQAREAARTFENDLKAEGLQSVGKDRENLTEQFIFTIDPPDAKDFDDAISIDYDRKSGEWTLGVHIADVAHFVRPGSAIAEEAGERGNSVYLPRLVLPMLPETLSNGVCSLQEGVPRFTKSVWITFDNRGKVLHQRVAATVIRSIKRLTYLEAQALIDGDLKEARTHTRTEPEYSDELIKTLRRADELARILRKRRLSDGMIVLNLPEVELEFDEEGHVIDAHPEDGSFTHTVIEMFMVEANEAIARLFAGLNIPLIRRIHPEPRYGDIEELRLYAQTVKFKLPDEPKRQDIQRLLDATRDTPAARAIHFAVLRTLTKATYSPALIGHFALGSDHYTHFTSPIRRFPDLSVHWAIEAYLDLTDNGRKPPGGRQRKSIARKLADDDRVLDEGELIALGRHCSDTEVAAEEAEQELRDFLVMQFLAEHHLGDEFEGVVTGLNNQGVFVSLERFLVEGLVGINDMPQPGGKPDRWKPEPKLGRIVAQRSGAVMGLGDIVTVLIVRIDLPSRHMDLLITKMPEQMRSASSEHPEASERGGDRGPGRDKKGEQEQLRKYKKRGKRSSRRSR